MFLKFTKKDVLIVVLMIMLKFGVGFIGGMVIPIFPSLVRIYFNTSIGLSNFNISSPINSTHYNYKQLSILFVTKNLCQIILSPIVGSLVDIFGAVVLLFGGTVFQLLTLLVYAFGNLYYLIVIGRIFEAVSTSIINCASAAWVAFRFKDHRQRGFVYGVKALSYCVGGAVGPAYGGVIYEFFGKTTVFLAFISFVFVEFCLVILFIVVENRSVPKAECVDVKIELIEIIQQDAVTCNNSLKPVKEIKTIQNLKKHHKVLENVRFFKDLYFLVSIGTFPVIFISIYLLNSSLSRYMAIRFHASEYQQGVVWIVNLLGYALGFLIGNIINTKISSYRHIILMVYAGLHAISVSSIPFMTTWWSVSVPLCVIVHVHLVAEVVISPILASIVEVRHSSKFGVMSGIIMMSTSITGSLGSFLGPVLLSTVGFMYMNLGVAALSLSYAPMYLLLGKFSN